MIARDRLALLGHQAARETKVSLPFRSPGRTRSGTLACAHRSDDTNGTSLSVIFYYQMTYDSTFAADLRLIQICAKVHLAKTRGIPTF
jgi:hypothetical protein